MKFAIFCLAVSLAVVWTGIDASLLRKRSIDSTNPQNEANPTSGQTIIKAFVIPGQQQPSQPAQNTQPAPVIQLQVPTGYPQQPPNYYPQQPPNYYPQQPPNYYPQQPPNYYPQQPPNYYPQQPPNYYPQQPPNNYPQLPPNFYPQSLPTTIPTTTTADPMCPEGKAGPCRELPLGQIGGITFQNNAIFTGLQFFVEYKVRDRKIKKESGGMSLWMKKTIDIPPDAEDIFLTIQNMVGPSEIFKRQFKYPVIRCYATTDAVRVPEVGCV